MSGLSLLVERAQASTEHTNSPPVLLVALAEKTLLVVVSVSELEERCRLFQEKPLQEVNQKRAPFALVDPIKDTEKLLLTHEQRLNQQLH
jgi:hypothetical protein